LGRFAGFNRIRVPVLTISSVRRFHSSSEPSAQTISLGCVLAATCDTHSISLAFLVGAVAAMAATDVSAIVMSLLKPSLG
jgi:hypothetical protein